MSPHERKRRSWQLGCWHVGRRCHWHGPRGSYMIFFKGTLSFWVCERAVPLWNRAENGSVTGNLWELIRLDGFLLYDVPPIRLSSTHFVFTSVRGSVWLRESARCDLVMLLILLHVAVMGVGLWLLCAHIRTQRDSVETKQPLKRLQEKKCRNSHMALLILPAPHSCCFLHCEQRWYRDVRMQKRNPKYFFYSVHA